MKVVLKDFKAIDTTLRNHFYVRDYKITKTRSYQYSVKLCGKDYIGEIPSFPLFWRDQNLENLKNIEFDLDKLYDYELDTNILFSLELLKKTIEKEFENVPLARFNSLLLDDQTPKSSVIKLKIGRLSPKEENRIIKNLLKNENRIRLDGNQMLSPENLSLILDEVDTSFIEYIEEPFKDIETWQRNYDRYNIGLALDENLHECLGLESLPEKTVAFIIKPSLNFGINKTINIIEQQQYLPIKKVISSSFEHPLSFNALIHLGSKSPTEHGLGTMELLNMDQNPFICKNMTIKGFAQSYFQI